MGRPLEPGTYYVGVYNSHATQATSYTVESRGIGVGQTFPVTDLSYAAGSSATLTNLSDVAYFKVTIPPNTPSWEITLEPSQQDMWLGVRRGAVPDSWIFIPVYYTFDYWNADVDTPQADNSREVPLYKAGPERYVLLPRDNQDYLIAGDYYLSVNPHWSAPAVSSSGILTSRGALAATNLGAASIAGTTQAVNLAAGQLKAYQFTGPAGTASLEVRLDNRVGNPWLSLVPGTRVPMAARRYYTGPNTPNREAMYGFNDGQVSGGWVTNASLLTIAQSRSGCL